MGNGPVIVKGKDLEGLAGLLDSAINIRFGQKLDFPQYVVDGNLIGLKTPKLRLKIG